MNGIAGVLHPVRGKSNPQINPKKAAFFGGFFAYLDKPGTSRSPSAFQIRAYHYPRLL